MPLWRADGRRVGARMPLYDFTCPKCGQVYEVKRPVSRMTEPLLCMDDQTPCERAITVPSFVTKDSASFSEPTPSQAASTFSHHGHSHGPGEGGHSHGVSDPI